MNKIANFIVKFRRWILLLFVVLIVYSIWGMGQVTIEYSITAYLPKTTDTARALDIMDEEFITYGTGKMMVRNVSYEEAESLHQKIEDIEGVKSFTFKNTPDYYKDSCALFDITYDGTKDDPVAAEAYSQTLNILRKYDLLIAEDFADDYAAELSEQINFVLVIAVIIIVVVLLFTSGSFMEVPVFLATFGVSALLNMGTNYWFGTISFISNSVCVILQLALAIDYAIILCNRFAQEKQKGQGDAFDALVRALAGAIPEICSSSLTTISGLLALATMTLRLGADLGFVLAKSILCSMFTVFLLMPALLMMFSKPIDKTTHRSFLPSVRAIGRFDIKFRYVLMAAFVAIVAAGTYFSFQTDYVYSQDSIDTNKPSSTMVAQSEIEKIFGTTNQFVVLVPYGDYDVEYKVCKMVEAHKEIDDAVCLSNVELTMNEQTHTLTEQINYQDLSLMLGTTQEVGKTIFRSYAFFSGEDTRGGLEEIAIFDRKPEIYTASMLQMCDCAFEHDDFIRAYLYDDQDTLDSYEDIRDQVQDAEDQLRGVNYTRIVFNLNGSVESPETFALIETLDKEVKGYCSGAIFAGDSMSSYDLNASFSTDNIKVSLLTVVFVFVILMITFRSWGIPIPLTATIQGAIFINFAYYAITGTNLFFFVYLIVSSIQMGATIDYAIVITNHFMEWKKKTDIKTAMSEAINDSFPTIFTSGSIMTVAAFLICFLVTDPLISTLGLCLGRGVIISIISVVFVLPALLVTFDKPISMTAFKERKKIDPKALLATGRKKLMKRTLRSVEEVNEEIKKEGMNNHDKE